MPAALNNRILPRHQASPTLVTNFQGAIQAQYSQRASGARQKVEADIGPLTAAGSSLQLRNEKRRILVVISDGCPMDSATNLANDEFYLAIHLKQVVACQEQRCDTEICGLGVGLDFSTYSSRSRAIDLPHSLNIALLLEIAQLIGVRRRQ